MCTPKIEGRRNSLLHCLQIRCVKWGRREVFERRKHLPEPLPSIEAVKWNWEELWNACSLVFLRVTTSKLFSSEVCVGGGKQKKYLFSSAKLTENLLKPGIKRYPMCLHRHVILTFSGSADSLSLQEGDWLMPINPLLATCSSYKHKTWSLG